MGSRQEELVRNLAGIAQHVQAAMDRTVGALPTRDRKPLLVIVTKTQSVDDIRTLIELGYNEFGESYIPGFRERQAQFPTVYWHYIGPLHRKYVAKVVGKAKLIHSVTNRKLLDKIELVAKREGQRQDVLIEVNVSGEDQKMGFTPSSVRALAKTGYFGTLEWANVRGLMTMAPFTDDASVIRPVFRGLRELRDELMDDHQLPLTELSMGMTNDYEIAVEEGATILRIGTAVFK